MKTAIINNEEISTKIERVIRQADSALKRERERERERGRGRAREQKQGQERDRSRGTRDRDRERDETMKNEIETMRNDDEDDEMKNVLAAK